MSPPRSRASILSASLLARHQIAAALATVVDFAAMIALVEIAGMSPPIATMVSAVLGAATNFKLSRAWAYAGRHDGTRTAQVVRYAIVSLGGALVNATLLAIFLGAFGGPYALVRGVVSALVSVVYTYPLHTRVVFRVAR